MTQAEIIDVIDKATILIEFMSKRCAHSPELMDRMIDWTIYIQNVISKIAKEELHKNALCKTEEIQ